MVDDDVAEGECDVWKFWSLPSCLCSQSLLCLYTHFLCSCVPFFSPCPSHFLCTYKGYVETNVQLCEANCAQPVPETSVTIIISELCDYGIEELACTEERKGAEHHILFCQALFGGCCEYTHSWAVEVMISCAIEWKLEVSKPSLCTNFSSTVKPHLIDILESIDFCLCCLFATTCVRVSQPSRRKGKQSSLLPIFFERLGRTLTHQRFGWVWWKRCPCPQQGGWN